MIGLILSNVAFLVVAVLSVCLALWILEFLSEVFNKPKA